MFREVTAVTLTQVCAEYEDPVAGDSYLLVSLELPWTLGRYSVMGSRLSLISSFLLDQGRADVILTGENLTHASSLILGYEVVKCSSVLSEICQTLLMWAEAAVSGVKSGRAVENESVFRC